MPNVKSGQKKEIKKKSLIQEVLEVIVPAFLIFLVVKTFLFESRWVPSPSMVPTIAIQDRFLENKIIYRLRQPKRGEIIVFHPPQAALPPGVERSDDLVKRLVGLPGEMVTIRSGRVYIKGPGETSERLLPEPYVDPERMDYLDFGPFVLGEEEYLVLGDNRRQSRDSRYWGTVPRRNVSGKAFWRFWPLNKISVLR